MTVNYLQYIDDTSPESVQAVHLATNLTQVKAAEIAGVGLQTYKGWCSQPNNANYRKPHQTTWNLFLFELQVRRLGHKNLLNFVREKG